MNKHLIRIMALLLLPGLTVNPTLAASVRLVPSFVASSCPEPFRQEAFALQATQFLHTPWKILQGKLTPIEEAGVPYSISKPQFNELHRALRKTVTSGFSQQNIVSHARKMGIRRISQGTLSRILYRKHGVSPVMRRDMLVVFADLDRLFWATLQEVFDVGFTQADLAAEANMRYPTVYDIFTGEKIPSPAMRKKLFNASKRLLTFRARLQLAIDRGWTETDIAAEAEVSLSMVSRVLLRKRNPRPAMQKKLLAALARLLTLDAVLKNAIASGFTGEDIALEADVDKSTVSLILARKRNASPEMRYVLLDAVTRLMGVGPMEALRRAIERGASPDDIADQAKKITHLYVKGIQWGERGSRLLKNRKLSATLVRLDKKFRRAA